MKKIFTFIASIMLFASAFAQHAQSNSKDYGYTKDKDVSYNDGRYKKDYGYSFSKREMDMQIASINRDYDKKIQTVKMRLFMSPSRKARVIRQLEDQRRNEIKDVYAKFNDRKNRFDDHDQKRNW